MVYEALLESSCDAVVIATRHNSHAELVRLSIESGKHVFVEKPLCISKSELDEIQSIYTGEKILMVGFNRRFAPLSIKLKAKLDNINTPKSFIYTCNADHLPKDHWIYDPDIGGGRIIGEACHFVDYLRYLADSKITSLKINQSSYNSKDIFSIDISFEDGSIGSVHYFANGHHSFQKERIEVFCDKSIFCLDNFKNLTAWGIPKFRRIKGKRDKGQDNCVKDFLHVIEKGGKSSIPFSEIVEVHSLLLDNIK